MEEYTRDTFQRLSSFEILLRRVLRWELMSSEGRSWLLCLGDHFNEIELRIKREKNAGLYSKGSSELSYLTLSELIRIIFSELWFKKFSRVFSGDKGLSKLLINSVVPLRNKLAHFRPIDIFDLSNLKTIHIAESLLKKFYSNDSCMEFYLSSDPDWVDEMLDEDNINEIRICLSKYNLIGLLDEFWKIDSIRNNRYWPGIGLYKDHIFIELHYFEDSPALDIESWLDTNKHEVTLITKTQSKLRFFWPIILGKQDIKKGIIGLQRMITHSSKNRLQDNINFTSEYFVQQHLSNRSFGVAL